MILLHILTTVIRTIRRSQVLKKQNFRCQTL